MQDQEPKAVLPEKSRIRRLAAAFEPGTGFFSPVLDNRRGVQVIALGVFLLLWEIGGRVLGEVLLAPFSVVAVVYVELLLSGVMWEVGAQSFREMFIGFGLAASFAIPVGILMGRSRISDRLLNPWVKAFFATSTSALLPLLIVLLGIDLSFRLAIVWLACVWHILLNVYHGATGVDPGLLDVGKSFNVSTWKRYKSIIMPAILPYIVAGLRMGLTRAIRGIILAEFYIATGYGGLIAQYGNQSVSTAPVLALAVTIMIVGYTLRKALEYAQLKIAPWSEGTAGAL